MSVVVWFLAVTFDSSHQSLYLWLPLQGDLGKRPTAGGPPCGAEGNKALLLSSLPVIDHFFFLSLI